VEADSITNQDFSSFSEKNRVEIKYSDIQWLVLDKVMEASRSIFEQVHEQRQKAKERRDAAKEEQGSTKEIGNESKRKWKSSSFSSLKRAKPW
jgi:hypothetical protein